MKYALTALVSIIATAAVWSCSTDHEPPATVSVTHVPDPTDAIDQKLMLALSQAKNLHHKAKVYMSDGNITGAMSAVREILSLRFPSNAPEAEDVRNDARALLARLLVGQGQLDDAMTVVTEGIAGSQRESFFVANLYTVKGEIHEARAVQFDADAASKPKAIEEKHAAIESFDKSNQIDKVLQDHLMESR